jgi:hypothetical protein
MMENAEVTIAVSRGEVSACSRLSRGFCMSTREPPFRGVYVERLPLAGARYLESAPATEG